MNRMKYIYMIFILIFYSCSETIRENKLNKSFTLNSVNKMNVDSLKSIPYHDLVEYEKDSITLETKKHLFVNLTFNDSLSNVNIQLNTNEFFSTVSITADSIGCVMSNPKLLFIVNDESKYDFSVYTGDNKKCTRLFLSSSEPYDMYGTTKEMIGKEIAYGSRVDKIRLVKNDTTYVDMILNNSDRELLHKYYNAKLVEFNNN